MKFSLFILPLSAAQWRKKVSSGKANENLFLKFLFYVAVSLHVYYRKSDKTAIT